MFDTLPYLKGHSYWFHAGAEIPSAGSGHDGLTSPEDGEEARKSLTAFVPDWAREDSLARVSLLVLGSAHFSDLKTPGGEHWQEQKTKAGGQDHTPAIVGSSRLLFS